MARISRINHGAQGANSHNQLWAFPWRNRCICHELRDGAKPCPRPGRASCAAAGARRRSAALHAPWAPCAAPVGQGRARCIEGPKLEELGTLQGLCDLPGCEYTCTMKSWSSAMSRYNKMSTPSLRREMRKSARARARERERERRKPARCPAPTTACYLALTGSGAAWQATLQAWLLNAYCFRVSIETYRNYLPARHSLAAPQNLLNDCASSLLLVSALVCSSLGSESVS